MSYTTSFDLWKFCCKRIGCSYWIVLGEARGWLFIECIWIDGLWDCKLIEFGLFGPFIGLCGGFGKTCGPFCGPCGPWFRLWPFIGLISRWFGGISWLDSWLFVGWANVFILNELDVAQFWAEMCFNNGFTDRDCRFQKCVTKNWHKVTKLTQLWHVNMISIEKTGN